MLTTTKGTLIVAPLAAVAAILPAAAPSSPPAPAPAPPVTAQPTALPAHTLVKTERIYPRRVMVLRSRFHPPATPPPSEVPQIIDREAARVGASAAHLRARVACESHFQWWARNGQYGGVGQFAYSTFARGIASLDTRVVTFTKTRRRTRHVQLVDVYADGTTRHRIGWKVGQLVVHHFRGVLPRNPPREHAWAQIRVMALAMVGRSAVHDGEWSCR